MSGKRFRDRPLQRVELLGRRDNAGEMERRQSVGFRAQGPTNRRPRIGVRSSVRHFSFGCLMPSAFPLDRSGPDVFRANRRAGSRSGVAEREGFEPSIRFNPYDALAKRCFRPLSHLSGCSGARSKAAQIPCVKGFSFRVRMRRQVNRRRRLMSRGRFAGCLHQCNPHRTAGFDDAVHRGRGKILERLDRGDGV